MATRAYRYACQTSIHKRPACRSDDQPDRGLECRLPLWYTLTGPNQRKGNIFREKKTVIYPAGPGDVPRAAASGGVCGSERQTHHLFQNRHLFYFQRNLCALGR